ncbi:MAG: glycosyltransferase [Candidatus Bathyarchaeota archaeon]|nr:glycosyltransferase [Candidatus Bathyarchaeum tardum]WGM89923.1 MAG: glycosyltransferase [Candidatus Bathyarchaeum tardum]
MIIQNGKGKGNAISEGLDLLNGDACYIVFTDADFKYPAKHTKEMVTILDLNFKVGMIFGDRFIETYGLESDRNQFYIGHQILGFVQSVFNGVKMNYHFTRLRIMRFELLKGWKPKSSRFDIEAELNRQVRRLGYTIVELPINYRKRLGKKKLGFRKILRRIIISSMIDADTEEI